MRGDGKKEFVIWEREGSFQVSHYLEDFISNIKQSLILLW